MIMTSVLYCNSLLTFANFSFEDQTVPINFVYGQYLSCTFISSVNFLFVLILIFLRILLKRKQSTNDFSLNEELNVHQCDHNRIFEKSYIFTKMLNTLFSKLCLEVLMLIQVLITFLFLLQYFDAIWIKNFHNQYYYIQLFFNLTILIAIIFNYTVGCSTYLLTLFMSIKRSSRLSQLFIYFYILFWIIFGLSQCYQLSIVINISNNVFNHISIQLVILSFLINVSIIAILVYQFIDRQKVFNSLIIDFNQHTLLKKFKYLHQYSSTLSKATFSWFFNIVRMGNKKTINIYDLGFIPKKFTVEYQSERFSKVFQDEYEKSTSSVKCISLWRCYWKIFKLNFICLAFLKLLTDLFGVVGPLSINYLLSYVDKDKTTTNSNQKQFIPDQDFFKNGFVLAFLVLCSIFLQSTFSNCFNHLAILEGINLKSALQNLIYQKSLKMTNSYKLNIGSIVNHMSSDTFNVMMIFSVIHHVWAVPLKMAIILGLLYSKLGLSAVFGTGIILILVPLQFYLMRKLSVIQKKSMFVSDERLKKIKELLFGIKVFKLLALERFFVKKIEQIRSKEVEYLKKEFIIVACLTFIIQSTSIITTVITFTIYPFIEQKPLTSSLIFPELALFDQLTVIFYIIPFVIPTMINAANSTNRLSKFFSQPEHLSSFKTLENFKKSKNGLNKTDYAIVFKQASFSLTLDCDKILLHNINLAIPSKKLTVITGPNGSGKTMLISAMIGEMIKNEGHIFYFLSNQTFGYLPQTPWLFNSTLKQNILFGEAFESERYQQIIKVCDLKHDIDLLPKGDETQLSEKGFNLSGGQKQRVALARAIYSSAPIVILDHPFSALDSHVANFIFDQAIVNLLLKQNRTVIMVTHDFKSVKKADKIIYMDNGHIVYNGTFLHLKNISPFLLEKLKQDNQILGRKKKVESVFNLKPSLTKTSSFKEQVSRPRLSTRYRKISCYDPYFLRPLHENWANKINSSLLKVSKKSSFLKFNSSNLFQPNLIASDDNQTNICKKQNNQTSKTIFSKLEVNFSPFQDVKLNFGQNKKKERIFCEAYWAYFRSYSPFFVTLTIGLLIFSQILKVITDFWLIYSTQKQKIDLFTHQQNKTKQTEYYFNFYSSGYCGLSVISIILSYTTNLFFQLISLKTARMIHTKMIKGIVSTYIQFFENTSLGKIINRFSSDISIIDKKISPTLPIVLRCMLLCISSLIVNVIVTPKFFFIAVLTIFIYYFIHNFFRSISKQLEKLENSSKSLLLAHFTQTLTGLATIKAFKKEKKFIKCFNSYINNNTLIILMLNCSHCWLGISLDYLAGLILFFSTTFGILAALHNHISSSFLGISITSTFVVPIYLNWVVRNLVFLEMNLGAILRTNEYINLKPEDVIDNSINTVALDLTSKASIEFKNVTLSYGQNQKPVLRGVNLYIKPGEKVGICGRTGSGKSSLILGLLKIMNITKGSILINGIDIKSVNSSKLRQSLAVIPQESILFSGSLKENLDPEGKYSDDQIKKVMQSIKVDQIFKNLDYIIVKNGANLSSGQKQLICLIRALLKDSGILIIDEATSDLDMKSQMIVEKIIAQSSKTIILITHKVATLVNFDNIVIFEDGQIIEKGSPKDLLTKESSFFQSLLKAEKVQ